MFPGQLGRIEKRENLIGSISDKFSERQDMVYVVSLTGDSGTLKTIEMKPNSGQTKGSAVDEGFSGGAG